MANAFIYVCKKEYTDAFANVLAVEYMTITYPVYSDRPVSGTAERQSS